MLNKGKFQLNILSQLTLLLIITCAGAGCKKQTVVEADFAILKVVGFVYDAQTVVANFSGKELAIYKDARDITGGITSLGYYNNYLHQSPQPLWLHAFPDTMPGSKPVMAMELALEKGQAYSLFVTGPKNDLDTFLLQDVYQPYNTKDSVAAVRFVNMMRTETISVNKKGEAPGSLVAGIPYKGYTPYIPIPISKEEEIFILEFRDAGTGALISEQMFNAIGNTGSDWLFKVRTIAYVGIRGATGVNSPRVYLYSSF